MDQLKAFSWDGIVDRRVEPKPIEKPAPGEERLTSVLRLMNSSGDPSNSAPPTRRSSPEDWTQLIERVRTAASRVREVETQAQEQELRVQDLLERVREDMASANERVKAAEAHARDIQMRADALLKAADERVKAAEERARLAEEWLARIYDTIASEFAFAQPEKRSA
ncbi:MULTISPECIES: hypothetical protein [Methylobacterium]|uniref:hypothetical protein n=1 Tax=Methylobacterium TaxID=407 RepID=UPI001FE06B52|nr:MULTISPECIES: hypothetical protein [Methylobacterium]MDR7035834.1 hypothetical protein [Methylobacterium sp. BE186]